MECPEVWGSFMLSPHYKIHTSVYQHSQPGVHEPSMIKSHTTRIKLLLHHRWLIWFSHSTCMYATYSPLLVALHEGLLANLHEEERSSTERKITRVKLKEY